MGWCSVGTSGEQCEAGTCSEIGGDFEDSHGPSGCLVLSLLEDEHARALVRTLIYPPVLRVRDDILPQSPAGRLLVADFEHHYAEAVELLRRDPDLFAEVIEYLTASVPFARTVAGEDPPRPPPFGHTPSSYTAERLRPAMLDWTSRILERFRSAASEGLRTRIEVYQRLLPHLENLTATELLTALRSPEFIQLLGDGRDLAPAVG